VPRDECFNHVKKADFTSYLLKAISAGILPLARELFDTAVPREFDDFEDMYKLYEGGITVDKAITDGRFFILDHHDNFIPQLLKINSLENTFVYATRTLLILQDDDTLKPIAIELSRPRLDEIGTKVVGADSKVYTPPSSAGSESDNKVQDTIWQLAKAYAAVNDSTWHGLISHWLHILHFP
jgi:hypothetical protein